MGRICTLDGVPVIGVAGCYSGSPEDGEKVLAPLRRFGSPVADLFGPMSYLQMQTMFDPWFPPGRQAYWKANFLHGLPDEAIEVFHRYALTAPSPYTTGPWLESVHGAVSRDWRIRHRVRPPAAPVQFPGAVELGPKRPRPSGTSRGRASAGTPCVRSWYPAPMSIILKRRPILAPAPPMAHNYDRLVALKNKYDPSNLFRINHNIRPLS